MSDEQEVQEILRAKAAATAARERLLSDAHAVQARLAPNRLASDAWDSVREKGEAVVQDAARAVARRPTLASVAVVGLAAAIARKPIARLFARWHNDSDD